MRKGKKYEKIDQILTGSSKGDVVEACIVLEGGAFRGMYTQGVLDALLEEHIHISCIVGTSAGALNGMNYASGQLGRGARMILNYRFDSRYVGTTAYKNNKGAIGFDFMFEEYDKIEPWDREWFERPEQRFVAVATNCETGKAEYMEKGKCSDILQACRASASMPYVSKMVNIDGTPYLDGGCACKIPYRWAIHEKYKKIVVVRTREMEYRKKMPSQTVVRATYAMYKEYPEFAKTLYHCNAKYNHQCEEIEQLKVAGKLYVISPSEPVTVGRLESNLDKLGDLYLLGYNDAKSQIGDLKKYLEI